MDTNIYESYINSIYESNVNSLVGKDVTVITKDKDKLEGDLYTNGNKFYVDGYEFEEFSSSDVKNIVGNKIYLKIKFSPDS